MFRTWPDANDRADQLAALCVELKKLAAARGTDWDGEPAEAAGLAEYVQAGLDEAIGALTARERVDDDYAPPICVVVELSPPDSGLIVAFTVSEDGMEFSLTTRSGGDHTTRDVRVRWGSNNGDDLADWFSWAGGFAGNEEVRLSVARNHI